MGDWPDEIDLLLLLVIGIGGLVIAFDYRNLGLKAYDRLSRWAPGGGFGTRFTPAVLRAIGGVMGAIFLIDAGVRVAALL
ncbi:hypothetical protein ACH4MA_16085 [Streptomyces roseolus]|uniref:hypothetical protein n=1 Tax=Streptomyces TaxID=1883 RepID=UPI001905488A|nr:hypothetical protein [Streptomyces sp. NE5-10]GHJ92084.1 hypothetical protein SNE510_16030 [Streptomyces sp. NE5-10]